MKETLNAAICIWCGNKGGELCVTHCRDEGRYRHLEAAPLPDWEFPPELPRFRDLLELPPVERLALLYLAAVYERRADEKP